MDKCTTCGRFHVEDLSQFEILAVDGDERGDQFFCASDVFDAADLAADRLELAHFEPDSAPWEMEVRNVSTGEMHTLEVCLDWTPSYVVYEVDS